MSTKGSFTRDEWNCLLRLLNSNFSSTGCQQAMSKRTQERTGEEIIVAKSKLTINLPSRSMAESSTAPSSTASTTLGSLRADSHGLGLIAGTGRPVAEDSNKSDAAWSSPEWQTGARSSAGAAVSTSQNQNPSAGTWRPVAWDSEVINIDLESPEEYEISADSIPHMERGYSKVRLMMNRKPGDGTDDFDENLLISGMFMSSPWNAAVHLGKIFWDPTMKQMFEVSQRLIKDQPEIFGVSQISWQTHPWERTSLLSDEAIRFSTAKVYVFSESVLCLGNSFISTIQCCMGKQIGVVQEFPPIQRIAPIRRRTAAIRVEKIPRIHYVPDSSRDSENDEQYEL